VIARAIPCPCGHRACRNWLVTPHADLQGVSFSKEEAEAVADLLNKMHEPGRRKDWRWPSQFSRKNTGGRSVP